MVRNGTPSKILLGEGVFKIGTTPIGFTRGGGQFTVERKVRQIDADGDKGIYVGRNTIDQATPKLKINVLELIGDNIAKLYPAIKTTDADDSTTITGTGEIEDTDYLQEVSFVGQTKAGKQVVIKVFNAINLENIDWKLADKDEVVADVTYTGCYKDDSPDGYEPWAVTYVK